MARKLTKNQNVVLDALKRAGKPLSAYQVLGADGVREQGVKAPLTVYRALEKLIEGGHVHRVQTLNAFVYCEHGPHAEPAAFMICADCKRTIEVPTAEVNRTLADAARREGFSIERVHIEIAGRCDACRS